MKYCVVIRNVRHGCIVTGPFKTEKEAETWGLTLRHSDWVVAPVITPHRAKEKDN